MRFLSFPSRRDESDSDGVDVRRVGKSVPLLIQLNRDFDPRENIWLSIKSFFFSNAWISNVFKAIKLHMVI